jgi:hypothetical protein
MQWNLSWSATDLEFRDEVRAFLDEKLGMDLTGTMLYFGSPSAGAQIAADQPSRPPGLHVHAPQGDPLGVRDSHRRGSPRQRD